MWCKRYIIIVIGYLFYIPVDAQELTPDSIYKRLAESSSAFHHTQLYLHADKSVYVHNENIWFTAYILNSPHDLPENHTLYVCLSNRATHGVVASEKFIMQNGLAAGYMFLPDSISPGDYDLLAYTNMYIYERSPRPFQQLVKLRAPSTTSPLAPKQTTPVAATNIRFQWFPEGGDLLQGARNQLAFEITLDGQPVQAKGYLLEDGTYLGPIQSNSAGLGKVDFTPLPGKKYSVEITEPKAVSVQSDFPEIKSSGFSMRIEKGVIGDTAIVKIEGAGKKAWLIMHNYVDAFHFVPLDMTRGRVTVKLPIEHIPAGLATLTLLDSTTHPCAERTVFVGYDSLPDIQMTTDSAQYHTRSKVVLKIKALDKKGKPLITSFSLASVLFKRIDTTSYQDIVPFSLYSNYVNAGIIPKVFSFNLGSRQDIEMFLLTRCWTKYAKPQVNKILLKHADDISMNMGGQVLFKNKPLKDSVEVSLVNGENIGLFYTDRSGYFTLPIEETRQRPDDRLTMFINKKFKEDYRIVFKNDDSIVNNRLAKVVYPLPLHYKAALQEEVIPSFNNVKTLSAVVIQSKKKQDADFFNSTRVYKSRTCNDYICMYNILNCKNHPTGGTALVAGQTYTGPGGQQFVYECPNNIYQDPAEIIFKLKGRYYTKKFYVADYSAFSPPEPETLSTIMWQPQVITDEKGETTISFYTNDIAGIFSCIIEGVSDKGPISGKKLVKVIQ